MDKELEVRITEDGNLESIYKDDLTDLYSDLGRVTVERASDVEFENGGWTVRCHKDPQKAIRTIDDKISVGYVGNIVSFKSRESALAKEVELFWELIGE